VTRRGRRVHREGGTCASALGRPCPSRASVAVHSVRITVCTHTHIIISWSFPSRSLSQPDSTAFARSHRADTDLPPFRPEAMPPPAPLGLEMLRSTSEFNIRGNEGIKMKVGMNSSSGFTFSAMLISFPPAMTAGSRC
jgi:hypothetical protein